MQDSTKTYAENVKHDFSSSKNFRREFLGCLSNDEVLGREMIASYIVSGEEMLKGLRLSLESFEKIVKTLGKIETKKDSKNIFVSSLDEWVEDVCRMFKAELANKRMCLAVMFERKDESVMDVWIEEPFINKDLLHEITK